MQKKFVLYYSPEFAGGERTQIVNGMSFFTENSGFRAPEIGYISQIKKGGNLTVGSLQIWRVK
jgi:hypothetical protein